MSIRDAGRTIRETRLKAGLTQEQLSDGVCSVLSLSRIENGSAGINPLTFQALMAHAGVPCEVYPVFNSLNDFECFYILRHAKFYLNSWQLESAYKELEKVEKLRFAGNRLYYQEWMYLQGKLQFRSGAQDHEALFNLFSDALAVTRKNFDLSDFRNMLLSVVEIELITALAQEYLYLNDTDTCLVICSQLLSYLSDTEMSYIEKDRLLAEHAVCYVKYLLSIHDYKKAFSVADCYRHKMAENSEDGPLFELTFLTALCHYYNGDETTACDYFKTVFYSAHSIESCYATICRNNFRAYTGLSFDPYLEHIPDIPCPVFPLKKETDISGLSDDDYIFLCSGTLTIGKLIRHLRESQNLMQIELCQGLCSKSKLSKIESDSLCPDVFLTEALLQRLGISEREFTFWGNRRESRIYDLKFKLIHSRFLSKDDIRQNLKELKSLISEKNILLKQLYYLNYAKLISEPETKISILDKALSYTLPDFDIRFIHNYHLSWAELSTLNNIAYTYRNKDILKSNLYFSKLLDYLSMNSPDILFSHLVFTLTIYMYVHSLYVQKHFHELVDLFTSKNNSLLKNRLDNYGAFLFYYCQSLGECHDLQNAEFYAHYACSIQELFEAKLNSDALKKYLKDDFNIHLT